MSGAKGRICEVEGCGRPHYQWRYCVGHFRRWEKYGDPLADKPLQVRVFWAKVDKDAPGGCWIWNGYRNPAGYGQAGRGGRIYLTHRLIYLDLVGEIPSDREIDHLCRVRACCNPAHLELVTGQENWDRGYSLPRINKAKTHCPAGHEYSVENTILEKRGNGAVGRRCRQCKSRRDREYRQRRLSGPSEPV